jgi:hypothetical protein
VVTPLEFRWRFVVAADGDFSNAAGVNGNQSNANAPFSGAAYVFTGVRPPLNSGLSGPTAIFESLGR